MSEYQEKLEYALTQAQLDLTGIRSTDYGMGIKHQFNNVVEECSKLNLLPKGAFERLYIK